MHIRIIRLRKQYRLKAWILISVIFFLSFLLIPSGNRLAIKAFFNTRCINYRQVVFSRRLNDRIVDYSLQAKSTGIERCENQLEIGQRISDRKLFRIKTGRKYIVEKMSYSYPYLTKDSRDLLDEIGKRFRQKITLDGLKGSRFIITSMTRTSEKLKGLGDRNSNVSENSPHLNGNAFDISYARFSFVKLYVTECDKWYLKEALAQVIWELRQEKKCWATYERNQGCFHVVSR